MLTDLHILALFSDVVFGSQITVTPRFPLGLGSKPPPPPTRENRQIIDRLHKKGLSIFLAFSFLCRNTVMGTVFFSFCSLNITQYDSQT
jgi:hypothetical protein